MDWMRRLSTWTARHRRAVDIATVLFFAAGGLVAATVVPIEGSERPVDWIAYVLVIAAAVTSYWRRTKPLFALMACVPALIAYWILDYPGGFDPVLWVMFYSATKYGGPNRRRVWRVVGGCLSLTLVVAIIGVLAPVEDLPLIAVFGIAVTHGTAAIVGEAMYHRNQHIQELEQRTVMLEADLENKAALAAVEERTRIAREMHDIVAHGMTTVVVQAQAGKSVLDSDPDKAREVFTTIEHIGRDSVDEMRRMLGLLRNDAGELDYEPQPGFDNFDDLTRFANDAGVATTIAVTGQKRAVPPGLELTAYRVVQEALTNVIRHAGRPASAEAVVEYTDDNLTITVVDDGLGAAASSSTAGTGHGLLGMRERVEIYHGQFTAGPRPGGGYQVTVSLPLPASVNASASP